MCYNSRQITANPRHFVLYYTISALFFRKQAENMKLLHQHEKEFRIFKPRTLDFPIHFHNAIEIIFLKKGSATVIYRNARETISAGDIFVAFPNQVHGYEDSVSTEGYVFIVPTAPFLTAYGNILDKKMPRNPFLRRGEWESSSLLELTDLAYGDLRSAYKAVLHGYILAIVGKLLSLLELEDTDAGDADVIRSVLVFLNDHYREHISRKDIAAAAGYNESYISHVFSEVLNTTLTDYVMSLRINDAADMLASTELSVSNIALSLGFGSIRSFNRAFLARMHTSPSAYRAMMK